jgi:hypothetical protein
LEGFDAFWWPGAIAWHRPRLKACEDRVGVGADVFVGPEVEGEAHRVAVALAE